MTPRSFPIDETSAGERLDRFVADACKIGRRTAQEWLTRGLVRVDGRRERKHHVLCRGSTVEVDFPPTEKLVAEASQPLAIAWQCEVALLVNKPRGQPCLPLRPGDTGTLAQALAGHFPELLGIGRNPEEAGLVHRLDNNTSGLVLVGRTQRTVEHLAQALSAGHIDKTYLALIEQRDTPLPEVVDAHLSPDPHNRRRVVVCGPETRGARPAKTELRLVRQNSAVALVEARARHAYRHQVRAHLAHVGSPLLGDVLYRGRPLGPFCEQHALHANYMAWAGDERVPSFRVRLDVPVDFDALLEGADPRAV